jgi:hypothetical protein
LPVSFKEMSEPPIYLRHSSRSRLDHRGQQGADHFAWRNPYDLVSKTRFKPNNSRDPLTAHGVPPVMLLYVFSHFQQEAVGDPAPPPFLDYFNRRVHKNQCDDEVPHDQTLVG